MNINVMNYVSTNYIILIPVLYVLGEILKGTEQVKDWTIPYILLVFSILIAIILNGLNPNSIVQAILCVGVAVYSNQLVKQTVKKREQDK